MFISETNIYVCNKQYKYLKDKNVKPVNLITRK